MKLGFKDWSILPQFLDYVEPRNWIPTHYRTDRKSDPSRGTGRPTSMIRRPSPKISAIRLVTTARVALYRWVKYEIELPANG
ncbi:MAG: hypothetical protein R2867_12880 [Caldilineaceae bacterium]